MPSRSFYFTRHLEVRRFSPDIRTWALISVHRLEMKGELLVFRSNYSTQHSCKWNTLHSLLFDILKFQHTEKIQAKKP